MIDAANSRRLIPRPMVPIGHIFACSLAESAGRLGYDQDCMDISQLQMHWNRFGKDDPLWAILTDPGKKGGRWDPDQFFALGHKSVILAIERLHALGYVPSRGKALDFGCGVGRLTQALCAHFDEVLGLDIAPSMIGHAERLNRFAGKCAYRLNDTVELSGVESASVDFVLSILTLQHMRPEYSTSYIREFFRVLKPGGTAIFTLPCLAAPPRDATPLPAGTYLAEVDAEGLPGRVAAGSLLTLKLSVVNKGDHPWPGGFGAASQICVGNHWLDSAAAPVKWDDSRVRLARWVAPGDSAWTAFQVHAPREPGSYLLEFDMVHEHVCWFAERGSPTCRLPVEVSGEPAGREPEPVMEMHGRNPREVLAIIDDAGGALIELSQDDSTAPPWLSYRYCAMKRW
jgi:SAM-dependent methyltransferase